MGYFKTYKNTIMKKFTNLEKEVSFYRMNNDVNGNPRYACHYLELLSKDEMSENWKSTDIDSSYNLAIEKARAIGGKKFHNKQFGGGIIFQSYNLNDEVESILVLSGRATVCHRQPTAHELKQGYGATHYRTFLKSDITKKDGTLKSWFKADDGLNYSTK